MPYWNDYFFQKPVDVNLSASFLLDFKTILFLKDIKIDLH